MTTDQMEVQCMLADAAQVAEGKLYILGGGWNIISVGAPSAIAIRVGVSAMTGVGRYRWKLVLNDEDGRAVTVPTAAQGFAPSSSGASSRSRGRPGCGPVRPSGSSWRSTSGLFRSRRGSGMCGGCSSTT